jgi:hypothetical protein
MAGRIPCGKIPAYRRYILDLAEDLYHPENSKLYLDL